MTHELLVGLCQVFYQTPINILSIGPLEFYLFYFDSVDWNVSMPYVVSGSGDNSLLLCSIKESNTDKGIISKEFVVENAHDGDINCVSWNPSQSDLLVTTGDDGLVKLWRLEL